MKIHKHILTGILGLLVGASVLSASAQLRVLMPQQGGTGIGSASSGDIGKTLTVSNNNPFTYTLSASSATTCSSSTDCIQVQDTNGDGDIAPELQTAINSLVWPSGTLTTEPEVKLVAPTVKSSYNLSQMIVICGDTTPPSGSTAPNCSGTQKLPKIHFVGNWSSSVLKCTQTLTNVVQNESPCFKFGDAWADGGDFDNNVNLEFDTPLNIKFTKDSDFTNFQMGVWCDGCSGELKAKVNTDTNSGGFFANYVGPVAVIAGQNLNSQIVATSSTVYVLPTVVFDGNQNGSTAIVKGNLISLEIGSVSAVVPRWGPADGCSYNGYSGECDNLHILPETYITGYSSAQSLLEVGNSESTVIDGTYHQTAASNKPSMEVYIGPSALGSSARQVLLNGTCISSSTSLNSCIRLIGSGVASHLSNIVFNGSIISKNTQYHPDKAGIGCNTVTPLGQKQNARIILGPNASMRATAGGWPTLLNAVDVNRPGNEPCDVTSSSGESKVVRIPTQTLGSSLPYCVDWQDGTWRNCTDSRTKFYKEDWSNWWIQRGEATIHSTASSTLSCNVRLMKDGTSPMGTHRPLTDFNYYPNGFSFNVGGQVLNTAGATTSYNVSTAASSTTFVQLQANDDYSNVGFQQGCIATATSTANGAGYATASSTNAVTLTDDTKSWVTNEHVWSRLIIEGGTGAMSTRNIVSNTAHTLTVDSALPRGGTTDIVGLRTKYRIVPSATSTLGGNCTCSAGVMPDMDFKMDIFRVNQSTQ